MHKLINRGEAASTSSDGDEPVSGPTAMVIEEHVSRHNVTSVREVQSKKGPLVGSPDKVLLPPVQRQAFGDL